MSGDEFFSAFGFAEPDIDAIFKRAELGTTTDEDHRVVTALAESMSDALPSAYEILGTIGGLFGFGSAVEVIEQMLPMINTTLEAAGFAARITMRPTYRTEPIPGAELGGTPRNPEAAVIDEIDQLVEWQMKDGER